MAGRLEGKVCVITGAGGGMGADAAVRFTEEGARIVVADVDGPGRWLGDVDQIRCAQGPLPAGIEALIERTKSAHQIDRSLAAAERCGVSPRRRPLNLPAARGRAWPWR